MKYFPPGLFREMLTPKAKETMAVSAFDVGCNEGNFTLSLRDDLLRQGMMVVCGCYLCFGLL